jgi:hypothetical protein
VSFQIPDEGSVQVNSMNDIGVVVGSYFESSNVLQAFIRSVEGKITSFQVQPGVSTAANDINLFGEVAGYYLDSNNVSHGFDRSAQGTIATFDPTGSIWVWGKVARAVGKLNALAVARLEAPEAG